MPFNFIAYINILTNCTLKFESANHYNLKTVCWNKKCIKNIKTWFGRVSKSKEGFSRTKKIDTILAANSGRKIKMMQCGINICKFPDDDM